MKAAEPHYWTSEEMTWAGRIATGSAVDSRRKRSSRFFAPHCALACSIAVALVWGGKYTAAQDKVEGPQKREIKVIGTDQNEEGGRSTDTKETGPEAQATGGEDKKKHARVSDPKETVTGEGAEAKPERSQQMVGTEKGESPGTSGGETQVPEGGGQPEQSADDKQGAGVSKVEPKSSEGQQGGNSERQRERKESVSESWEVGAGPEVGDERSLSENPNSPKNPQTSTEVDKNETKDSPAIPTVIAQESSGGRRLDNLWGNLLWLIIGSLIATLVLAPIIWRSKSKTDKRHNQEGGQIRRDPTPSIDGCVVAALEGEIQSLKDEIVGFTTKCRRLEGDNQQLKSDLRKSGRSGKADRYHDGVGRASSRRTEEAASLSGRDAEEIFRWFGSRILNDGATAGETLPPSLDRGTVNRLEEGIQNLRSRLDIFRQEVEEKIREKSEESVREWQAYAQELENSQKGMEEEVAGLRAGNEGLREQIAEFNGIQRVVDRIDNSIGGSSLEERVQRLGRKMTEAQRDAREAEARRDEAIAERNKVEQDFEGLRHERDGLKGDLEEKERSLVDMRGALASSNIAHQEELDRLREDHAVYQKRILLDHDAEVRKVREQGELAWEQLARCFPPSFREGGPLAPFPAYIAEHLASAPGETAMLEAQLHGFAAALENFPSSAGRPDRVADARLSLVGASHGLGECLFTWMLALGYNDEQVHACASAWVEALNAEIADRGIDLSLWLPAPGDLAKSGWMEFKSGSTVTRVRNWAVVEGGKTLRYAKVEAE